MHTVSAWRVPDTQPNPIILSFLSGIAQITSPTHPSSQFGQLVPLILDVKNDVLARITETSNDDYDNDWSNDCDYDFDTFDDFGAKKWPKSIT